MAFEITENEITGKAIAVGKKKHLEPQTKANLKFNGKMRCEIMRGILKLVLE